MALGISSTISLLTSIVYVLITAFPANSSQGAVKTYVATAQVYVQNEVFNKWKRLMKSEDEDRFKTEIKSLFVEAGELYKSLIPMVNFTFDFDVLNITMVEYKWSPVGSRVDPGFAAGKVLDVVKEAEEIMSWNNKFPNVKADISVLFISDKFNYGVVAEQDSICTSKSSAMVVRHTGSMNDALSLANGFGQVLGAHNKFKSLSHGAHTIMDSGRLTMTFRLANYRHYEFLNTSAESFRNKIDSMNHEERNCLIKDSKPNSTPHFGQLVKPEELCHNINAYYLPDEHYQNQTGFVGSCVTFMCRVLTGIKTFYPIHSSIVPTGYSCGQNKVCRLGKCVVKENGPTVISARTEND